MERQIKRQAELIQHIAALDLLLANADCLDGFAQFLNPKKARPTDAGSGSLNIGLDYDGTYTADPELWDGFVRRAVELGHRVAFVTFRSAFVDSPKSNADIERSSKKLDIPIYYTAGQDKYQFTTTMKFPVNVWIDDVPWSLPESSSGQSFAQTNRN